MKSYVTIATCAWCSKELNELLLDKKMREIFDMHTKVNDLCDDCKKQAIIMFDRDSKQFLGYIRKSVVMTDESLKNFDGQTVKALVKINDDKSIRFYEK
jgi:hypothetical protein